MRGWAMPAQLLVIGLLVAVLGGGPLGARLHGLLHTVVVAAAVEHAHDHVEGHEPHEHDALQQPCSVLDGLIACAAHVLPADGAPATQNEAPAAPFYVLRPIAGTPYATRAPPVPSA